MRSTNQSINHTREILGKRTTQEFIPRFTCFPASYFSLWRYIQSRVLGGRRTTAHKMEILQTTSSTRIFNSRTPVGKDQEPLTILGEGSNNLQLRAQSPPLLQAAYRVGKHGRVTRNPQQLEEQVPLECNSQVMHLNLTQSHSRCATKQRDK
jgi:hypothetical protein